MADTDVARDQPVGGEVDAPDTGQFQVQFGPDGACRLVLIDERSQAGAPRILATLTLSADDMDELARMLEPAKRRALWQQMADQAAKGAQH